MPTYQQLSQNMPEAGVCAQMRSLQAGGSGGHEEGNVLNYSGQCHCLTFSAVLKSLPEVQQLMLPSHVER